MRKEDLSEAIGSLPDDIIEEASIARITKKSRPYATIAKYASLAAVFALCIIGIRYLPNIITPTPVDTTPPIINPDEIPGDSTEPPTSTPTEPPTEDPSGEIESDTPSELPKLELGNSTVGFGMAALDFYDIEEYITSNPWSADTTPDTLPIYKNPISKGEFGQPIGTNVEKMRETLISVADRLGLDTDSLVITDDAPSAEQIERMMQSGGGFIPEGVLDPSCVMATTDEYDLYVSRYLEVRITFKNPVALPEKYRFTRESTPDQLLVSAEYIGTAYKKLMGFDTPTPRIYGGNYDMYGANDYELHFYDAGGNTSDDLVNYALRYASFHTNENGELYLIWLSETDLSNLVGEYPIISKDEAKELLKDGHFSTSCVGITPDFSKIAKVELVYRGGSDTYFMPYYRFYVDITGWSEYEEKLPGMKTYGTYYVPAISGEFIVDMPTYDGSFNS